MSLIRLLLVLLAVTTGTGAQAEWRRGESPNFIVYGDMAERELRDRLLRLEDFDRLMRVATSVNAPPAKAKLHVYFFKGPDALRRIRQLDQHVSGYYAASSEGIAAYVRTDRDAGGDETLLHEYAHHFMHQNAPGRYPGWYIEGFAEYFMTVRFAERHIDIGNFSRGHVHGLEGPWLPIEAMLSADPGELKGDARGQFYVQAWVMTHYLFSNRERQQALARLLVASRRMQPAAALQAATGMTGEAFTRELRRYINDGAIEFRRMPRQSSEARPELRFAVLPASTRDLIVHEAAMRVGIPEDQQAQRLKDVRAAAARHTHDPFARRVLAQAELQFGDREAAGRILEALVTETTTDPELLYWRGRLHLARADDAGDDDEMRTAASWLRRAAAADPNHWQTQFHLANASAASAASGDDADLDAMLRAQELAPQVASLRLNAAQVLIHRGDFDKAIRLLLPLISDPHAGGAAAAARRMLGEIASRQGDTEPTEDEAKE